MTQQLPTAPFEGSEKNIRFALNCYWDVNTLEWVKSTGAGGSGGTEYTEDVAAAADPVGTVPILVRADTPGATVTADGDNVAQRGTNFGAAYVTLLDAGGSPVSVGGGTQYTEDAAAAANPTGNAPILVRADTPAAVVTTDGDNVAQRGTNYGAAYVTLLDAGGSPVAVGGGTQYTEADTDASITGTAMLMEGAANALVPAQGTAADGLLVNLGTNNDVTVTGSVTATGPLTDTELRASSVNVTVANPAPGVPVEIYGIQTTIPVTDNGGSLTVDSPQLPAALAAGGGIKVEGVAGGVAVPISGTVTINAVPAGTNNIGDVDVLTLPNVTLAAGTNTNEVVGDVAHDSPAAGNPLLEGGYASAAAPADVSADADVVRAWRLRNGAAATVITAAGALIGGDAGNGLDVDVTRLPALVAGTANIGDVDVASIAAGDNNIGNVDIVTMPNVTLAAGTNTNEVVGDAAHDAAAAGNPILNAGIAQDMDDTAPPNRVSAEADAVRLAADRDGALFVHPHGPQIWSYHVDGSTALTDATVHAAPGAGLSLYVTDIIISTGAATALNAFFEEGATKVLGPYYLEAVAGRGVAIHFSTPKKITANTALTVTTSAAIAHSVDVTGFTAQG